MKNQLTLLVGVLVVLFLVTYMFFFQVRYDEVAVLTTFDKAGDHSIKRDAGLYGQWPWPIQKVTKYSTRVQVLEDQLEEVQTDDRYNVIVQTYLIWKVEDPLKFFVNLQNVERARESLRPLLRDSKGIISKYRFDELVNTNPERVQLAAIEEQSAAQLQERVAAQDYGIKIERVGIRKIVLPEQVTENVFSRMKKNREALAEDARGEGRAQAALIRSQADGTRDQILAFAERRAQAIRTRGDHEAAQYYGKFAQNEEFAIFLRQVEALKKMLGSGTTFVLPADQLEPLHLLGQQPGMAREPKPAPAKAEAAPAPEDSVSQR